MPRTIPNMFVVCGNAIVISQGFALDTSLLFRTPGYDGSHLWSAHCITELNTMSENTWYCEQLLKSFTNNLHEYHEKLSPVTDGWDILLLLHLIKVYVTSPNNPRKLCTSDRDGKSHREELRPTDPPQPCQFTFPATTEMEPSCCARSRL